jgi:hypothetical protein
MSDTLNLMKKLAGLEVTRIDENDYQQSPGMLIHRMEVNLQDLREIANGGGGSGQGILYALQNLLDTLKPMFPK